MKQFYEKNVCQRFDVGFNKKIWITEWSFFWGWVEIRSGSENPITSIKKTIFSTITMKGKWNIKKRGNNLK